MELHEENNRIRDSKKDCIFVCLFMFKSLYVDNSVASQLFHLASFFVKLLILRDIVIMTCLL